MNNQKLGFIGGGNMAAALLSGMLNNGSDAKDLYVADPNNDQLEKLRQLDTALNTYADGQELLAEVPTLVLAVKPQIMQSVVSSLAANIQPGTLIISIAAGVPVAKLQQWLGADYPIIRCMPNTPALVGTGASGLFATDNVSAEQKQQVEQLFNTVGISVWLDNETAIDHVIAVSGSGPAYFFYLMELMQQHGEALGLDPETAKKLTIQTALGAAQLAASSADDLSTLRANVTSKGGTTEAALQCMQQLGLENTIQSAMQAAVNRAAELAKDV